MRRVMITIIVLLLAIFSGCGEEQSVNYESSGKVRFEINLAPELAGKVAKVTVTVKANLADETPIVEQNLVITNNKAYGEVIVPSGAKRIFIIKLWSADGSLLATSEPQQSDVPAGGEIALDIKVSKNTGIVKINVTWDDGDIPIPPTPLAIQITEPKPNEQVPLLFTIKGKIDGVKDRQELIDKLKIVLLPGEELKVLLGVWSPNDTHGPWEQPSASIAADGTWKEDAQANFGREGKDIGTLFKIRAQLGKKKGADLTPIEEGITKMEIDVIRK